MAGIGPIRVPKNILFVQAVRKLLELKSYFSGHKAMRGLIFPVRMLELSNMVKTT